MALIPVVENASNKTAFVTFPHFRGSLIDDQYFLGFSARFGPNGEKIVDPIIYPPDPNDEGLDSISPPNWTGTTEVTHQGKVVFKPSGAPPQRNTAAFEKSFQEGQDVLFEESLFESMRKDPGLLQHVAANPATAQFAIKFEKKENTKMLMYVGAAIGISLVIGALVYRFVI